jgi:hypothetical protein
MRANDILTLSESEIRMLALAVSDGMTEHRKVRVAVDGGFKFKVGGGEWSPPMGERLDIPPEGEDISPRFYLYPHDASSQNFSGSARFHVIDRQSGRSVRAHDSEDDARRDIQIRNGLEIPR